MACTDETVAASNGGSARVVLAVKSDDPGPIVWLLDDSVGRYLRLGPDMTGDPVESDPWAPPPPRTPFVWHALRTWFTIAGRLVIVPLYWPAFWVPLVPGPLPPFDSDGGFPAVRGEEADGGWTVFVEAA